MFMTSPCLSSYLGYRAEVRRCARNSGWLQVAIAINVFGWLALWVINRRIEAYNEQQAMKEQLFRPLRERGIPVR
jgi:hypothetical protein